MSGTDTARLPVDALELRDVPGPSPLGGGLRRSAELLALISATEFRKTYLGTALGYLWSLARPLMLFAVLLTVFTKVIRVGGVPHYSVLLLLNIVLYGYFQEVTITAVGCVVAQEAVVRKTQFPRLVIPLSVVLTGLLNLVPNLVMVMIFLLAFGVAPMWTWLLLPVIVLMLAGITTGVALIVSSLYPRFRDVSIIWTVFSTALFYATPILYTAGNLHHHRTLARLLGVNPLAPIFELARKWMVQSSAPGPAAAAGGALKLMAPVAIYLIVCLAGTWIFRREAPRIAEAL